MVCLPGSLADTGDLALISQRAEADTANAVVAEVGMGSAADLASVVGSCGKFRCSLLLVDHGLLSHLNILNPAIAPIIRDIVSAEFKIISFIFILSNSVNFINFFIFITLN